MIYSLDLWWQGKEVKSNSTYLYLLQFYNFWRVNYYHRELEMDSGEFLVSCKGGEAIFVVKFTTPKSQKHVG
jgi:hypothetical protein